VRSLIFDGESLTMILGEAARSMECALSVYHIAIWLIDEGGKVHLAAAPDFGGKCWRVGAHDNALEDYGCLRYAQQAGRPLYLSRLDQAAECARCPERAYETAVHSGRMNDVWMQPLIGEQEKCLGSINFYSDSSRPPDEETRQHFKDFAQLIVDTLDRSWLSEQMRQASSVFANISDGVAITDQRPVLISVNKSWCDISGYSENEVLGRNPSLLKSGLHGPEFYRDMWKILRETGKWQGEITNRHKDGNTYTHLLRINAVHDMLGRLTNYIAITTDLSNLKQNMQDRERLLHYDLLTRLPNRLLAFSRLGQALQRAERNRSRIGIVCLDLDSFKDIHNRFGIREGDYVLQQIAQRCQRMIRKPDTFARAGGDEFMLIFEQIRRPEDVLYKSQTILSEIQRPIVLPDKQEITVGCCMGISFYPDDGDNVHDLIQFASTALTQAKQVGSNQIALYTASFSEQARKRIDMEASLRQALKQGELSLHYQPQVDLGSGAINGLEALLRWKSSRFGDVPPGEFIPLAEQSMLILSIGQWVIEESCRQLRAWLDEGLSVPTLAVNVSVRQIKQQDLIAIVESALQCHGLEGGQLEIEITESSLLDDVEKAIAVSRQLRQLGVKLALDDFGTGYSSLAYLSRLPFDKIKIDQSFVRDMNTNPTNALIVNATIALAQSLRMQVLAEGVETESQLDFLCEHKCDAMQGYFFSRPLDANACAELLRSARRLRSAAEV
jgi:diguanylate cyclase (GGDEF)-like protein/PAS domain S-box-containing protein